MSANAGARLAQRSTRSIAGSSEPRVRGLEGPGGFPPAGREVARILRVFERAPICLLTGPSQAGKTGVARALLPEGEPGHLNLDDPLCLLRLTEPERSLRSAGPLLIIDEFQRMPELIPHIRDLVDADGDRRVLLLGSGPTSLLASLAAPLGRRLRRLEIDGLGLAELGRESFGRLWLRGGYPPSLFAASDEASYDWRSSLLGGLAELALRSHGAAAPALLLLRFLGQIAQGQSELWNGAEIARRLGFCDTTAKKYLDLFEDLGLVTVLRPWKEELRKRQIQSARVYLSDPGLLHSLLGVKSLAELFCHHRRAASWKTLVLREILRDLEPEERYHWGTFTGVQLDLLAFKSGRRLGFDVSSEEPRAAAPAMRISVRDLGLESLFVIHPGSVARRLGERIWAWPLARLDELAKLGFAAP